MEWNSDYKSECTIIEGSLNVGLALGVWTGDVIVFDFCVQKEFFAICKQNKISLGKAYISKVWKALTHSSIQFVIHFSWKHGVSSTKAVFLQR